MDLEIGLSEPLGSSVNNENLLQLMLESNPSAVLHTSITFKYLDFSL